MKLRITIALILYATSISVFAIDCDALNQKAQKMGDHVLSHESGRKTIGEGRIQFYSAPDTSCVKKGIFILPNEFLNAYLIYGDFTSVLYINPKTGNEADGWVRTSRLKETGTGVGPN